MKPPLRAYQVEDVATLLRTPAFGLWLQMRLGKSRIVIEAACRLFTLGTITSMIVVCPAAVRSVWADPSPVLGEVAKWATIPTDVREYRKTADLRKGSYDRLQVIVTNPEFLRRPERLKELIAFAKAHRVLLVGDESWVFKNPRAAQTKAMATLRKSCARVVLLNGTPGEPKDLYAQFKILDSRIWNDMNWFQWRNRFCKLGGYLAKQIVGYQNTEEFQRRTAPYAIVRKTRECLDLGAEPIVTQIEAPLTPATWKAYVEMREEMVTWLSTSEASMAGQAGVRVMRLAQITNGFLGGVQDVDAPQTPDVRVLGREKLDALIDWFETHGVPEKVVVFTRFRADVERTAAVLAARYPSHEVVKLYGAQPPEERRRAKEVLAPDGDPRPAIVVGNARSGGSGLDFSAAATCIYLARDFSLTTNQQSEARVVGPASAGRVVYLDILATGPKGERTLDHQVITALRKKEDVAAWTAATWRQQIEEAA